MHEFSGIMKQLYHLWFDSEYSTKPFSIRKHLKAVEEKCSMIVLPSSYTRNIRVYSDEGCHQKAHEWFVIARYVVFTVLSPYLDPNVYENVKLLIESVLAMNSRGKATVISLM
jgi:hypothetical protein